MTGISAIDAHADKTPRGIDVDLLLTSPQVSHANAQPARHHPLAHAPRSLLPLVLLFVFQRLQETSPLLHGNLTFLNKRQDPYPFFRRSHLEPPDRFSR